MPYLIDTHAHINFREFKEDGHEVIKKTLKENVWLINVGAEYKTSKRAVDYANNYKEGVYAAVGLHPIHLEGMEIKGEINEQKIEFTTRAEELDIEKYRQLAQNEKVVAIGEIGLDYKINDKKREEEIKEKQKETFFNQLDLALQMNKPVIIHCRQAYDDLIDVVNAFQASCATCPIACPGAGGGKLRGVVHCFVGSLKTAQRLVGMGFYLGFNGVITYSTSYDKVIEGIPLEKMILETDCPYLTPLPKKGERNKPLNVKFIAGKIAHLKDVNIEEVAEQTTKNARELFGV